MSAGVSDQRMKGQGNQVTNGPKEHVNDHEDFDSWRSTQHHQGYSTPISTTLAGSDPYSMSNYYGTSFPYQAFGVGDGTWSNGDPMTFLGGYGGQMGHDSYMDGMFGGGGGGFGAAAFGPTAAGFNYFHPAAGAGGGGGGGAGAGGGAAAGDYSTWGNSAAAMSRKPHYEDYYRIGAGSEGPYDGVKGVEQGMHALGIDGGAGHKELKDGKEMKESSAPKKMTWASIASQPAKPTPAPGPAPLKKKGPGMPPPPMVPGKHNMDIGTWDGKKTAVGAPPPSARPPSWGQQPLQGPPQGPLLGGNSGRRGPQFAPPPLMTAHLSQPPPQPQQAPLPPPPPPPPPHHPVLDELCVKNDYNPHEYDLTAKGARFFVIKSYSEDDIHRSIKYEIWCSTEHGNKRLDQAWREREGKGPVYLFFSVNGSGHFCGMAQMSSPIDYHASSSVWSQDKWKGQFRVRWVYVKDVPNVQLRHIRLENNENKPVTNSRDTQEVPFEKGRQVLRILHGYRHSTSIFDDFVHYETRQEEEDSRKLPEPSLQPGPAPGGGEHRGPQGHRQPQQGHQQHKDRGDGGRGRGRGGGPRPN